MFSCSFLLVLWLTGFEGFGGFEKGHCDVNDHEYEEILLRGDDQGCNYMKKYDSTLTFCIINIYIFKRRTGHFCGNAAKACDNTCRGAGVRGADAKTRHNSGCGARD